MVFQGANNGEPVAYLVAEKRLYVNLHAAVNPKFENMQNFSFCSLFQLDDIIAGLPQRACGICRQAGGP